MKNLGGHIADFSLGLSLDRTPKHTVEHAKLVLLDTLGACIRGSQEHLIRNVAKNLATQEDSGATLIGMKRQTAASLAAFVNSSAGAYLELDEAHKTGGTHCAVQILPACLAVGEIYNATGGDLLRSFIVSYEVGDRFARLNRAFPILFHSHGTWAVPGAALASAMNMHLKRANLIEALRISSNLPISPCSEASFQGASISNYYGGFAASNGVIAAMLASSGIKGARAPLTNSLFPNLGTVILSKIHSEIFGNLGKHYSILENYVKRYSSCAWTHPAIEAVSKIVRAIDLLRIRRVDVYTYKNASRCKSQNPSNTIAAKFSIPFVLASFLIHGRVDPTSFEEDSLRDIRVRRLSRKIFVFEDEEYTKNLPRWGAKVVIVLNQGRSFVSEVKDTNSLLDLPRGRYLAIEKFRKLVQPIIGKDKTAQVQDIVLELEKLRNVKDLMKLLQ